MMQSSRLNEIKPPEYSFDPTTVIDEDSRITQFKELILKHEISNLMALKLRKLEAFDIVIIADDSGSMQTKSTSNLTVSDPFAKTKTRWDELKETVAIVTEIAALLDEDGVDIFFLNRPPVRNITGPSAALDAAFQPKPTGYTPITSTLQAVLHEKWHGIAHGDRKKLLILIATDGQPTTSTGQIDKEGLKRVLVHERGNVPGEIPVCFLVCTDDDYEIEYLNEWDNVILDLDVVDDYFTERRQIIEVQGSQFPFSRGDWVCKMLLGAIDPEIDALDETPINSAARRKSTQQSKQKSHSNSQNGCEIS
ncbi:hypothetical protein HK100_001747 [Physocladia obscura]|uniref:VWFA domain-containing protein n=1 Tax=Physocladia obscura TaxID=109957 RepID=A0AAD5XGB0_9FUNG|nr:hypothetical protein HK100_001747 [Physocladia obscura]